MSMTLPNENTTAVPEGTPPPQQRPRAQVIIFGLWCKGCRLCVEFCPRGVLAMDDDDHPVVVHPERCTACHWCDTHCPDLAIVVRRIETQEAR